MSKARELLLGLSLLALVLSGPAAVAAYLFAGDAPQMMPATTAGGGPAADSATSTGGANPSAGGVLTGVLYTTGTALVDWNGVIIPVQDGSYAYLGGEVVSTDPRSMGVLRLDADNRVYMCPGSRMRLARGQDGSYRIGISKGGGRFAFAAGTDYRIELNQGLLSPGGVASVQPTVVEVAVFQDHPGGVVCGFSGRIDVAGYAAGGDDDPIMLGSAGPGEILDLSRALGDEAASSGTQVVIQPIAMPASTRRWLRDNAPYPPEPGPIGYLCRCEELKRYAEADGIPQAAIVPRMSPPAAPPLAELSKSGGLPLAPPGLSSIVFALPAIPDAADPGAVFASVPLTVPAPLVPVRGSGGGFVSTPS